MAVCERCEGTSFELHDGFYFCTNCALQSQELVQFEEETIAAVPEDAAVPGTETLTNKGRQKKLTTKGLRSRLRRMCELARDIAPTSSLLITKTILEKLADIFLIDLTQLQREKFDRILWQVWAGYEKHLQTLEGKQFSMRDYFCLKQPKYFYLLYLYGLWDTKTSVFRESVKSKMRKRKDDERAAQDLMANVENKQEAMDDGEDEAAFANEIEQLLSDLKRRLGREKSQSEAESEEEESVTVNATMCTRLTQQEVVVEDFEIDPEVNVETRRIVNNYFQQDEQVVLTEAHNWYLNIFGAGSKAKGRRDPDHILRPMPRVAYGILYMVSMLINKPIFLNHMIQKAIYNEAPLLDLVTWMPDVVLTQNEFNVWVNAGMNALPAIIRNIAKRLFRVLFNGGLLPSECIEPSENEWLRGKCDWALRFLNLPLSLSQLCLSLLERCRIKLVFTRHKQRYAIIPDCILHFDVFIFVSIFIVKHVLIDSCDDKRMKKLSRLWRRWAHRTLFGKPLPPHMLTFGDKLQLQHDDSVLSYLKISRHLNTLKFRNRFHNYRRFDFPNWAQKQLILWEMLSDNLEVEAHIEDYSIFVDKKVERILKTDDVSNNVREFELKPNLSGVKLTLDEDFVLLSITSQCRQLASSKKVITASLKNEEIMYYDVTNMKLERHSFADGACALSEDREIPPGIDTVMELQSEETLDFDSHKETLVDIAEDFERKTRSKLSDFESAHDDKIADCGVFVERKEGLESFGIYDELFCVGALVGGDDFRLAVREFMTIVGKT